MEAETALTLREAGALISDPATYQRNEWAAPFALLRREDPVHYVQESMFGPYWALTKLNDIKAIEEKPQVFSSDADNGGIAIQDLPPEFQFRSFFLMDPPEHGRQRAVVNILGMPRGVARFEDLIRSTARQIIAELPRDEPFDWVDRVSVELTSIMLCALMDYPVERRRELVYWSDVMIAVPGAPGSPIASLEEREVEKVRFTETMMEFWERKAKEPPSFDLVSMLAHSEIMNALSFTEKMGVLITFLVGGNDTTRNTMSGGLWALGENPDEAAKLRADRALIPSFVQESLRWQTPTMHMRRTAMEDYEFRGRQIRKGDKVVMWYLSANRDEEVIDRPNDFLVDRPKPAPMLSFGHGIHRCLGARLSELQQRVLWEEFFKADLDFDVVSPPIYGYSPNLRSIQAMSVVLREGEGSRRQVTL